MYCKNCGNFIDDNSTYCPKCGTNLKLKQNQTINNDHSSFGFALFGFFIPLIGLILFLIYDNKKPKMAKSALKGAVTGFLTNIIITIILVILYIVFAASIFTDIENESDTNLYTIGDIFHEESTEEILEQYVDITFGKFNVSNNGYYSDTSLGITVKNKSDKQYTYSITIEAVDANGARIETDTIYADRLNAGQEIHLKAFEYVEEEKIDQFKKATFKVLEISKYDF